MALVGPLDGWTGDPRAAAACSGEWTTWVERVTDVVTLGTPHLGAPLARGVKQGSRASRAAARGRPAFGRILDQRSVGVARPDRRARRGLRAAAARALPPRLRDPGGLAAPPGQCRSSATAGAPVPSAYGRDRRGRDLFPDGEVLHLAAPPLRPAQPSTRVAAALTRWLRLSGPSAPTLADRLNALWANSGGYRVEVSVLRANVARVNQNSSPALSPEMNGAAVDVRSRRPHLPAAAPRADRLPRLRGPRPERQRDLRPAAAALGRGPRGRHLPAHQQPRWLRRRRHGDLRHDELHPQRRGHGRHGPGRLDGPVPALRRHQGQALRPAARADHDAPAVLRHGRLGLRHQDPGPAVAAHQEGAARPHRRAHRPARRAGRSPTPTATAGSPPTRRSSTAWSTRSSPTPAKPPTRAAPRGRRTDPHELLHPPVGRAHVLRRSAASTPTPSSSRSASSSSARRSATTSPTR